MRKRVIYLRPQCHFLFFIQTKDFRCRYNSSIHQSDRAILLVLAIEYGNAASQPLPASPGICQNLKNHRQTNMKIRIVTKY